MTNACPAAQTIRRSSIGWGVISTGLCVVLPCLFACQAPSERIAWALAIHGGAGTIPKDIPIDVREQYETGLHDALLVGKRVLEQGGTSVDAVEQVVVFLEDHPHFNAGKGAVYNHAGGHELDASIMVGTDLRCGAVAGVRTVKNPIRLARKVMEETRHVLLAADGADAFAREQGFEAMPQDYFATPRRLEQWKKRLEKSKGEKGTVGAVALDRFGHLAAATSTGGLTDKRLGRIGDSPIVGAGTFADDRTCAVSATGIGEEFIRNGVARDISARMSYGDRSLASAAREVVHEVLRPGDGGIIAVGSRGELVAAFNTAGMYRGLADANGRFDVAIW